MCPLDTVWLNEESRGCSGRREMDSAGKGEPLAAGQAQRLGWIRQREGCVFGETCRVVLSIWDKGGSYFFFFNHSSIQNWQKDSS